MPIGVVACIVRDKIPNYLSNVPIPRSLRGFFDLTLDEWIQLVSFSAICGGVLYVTAYPLYVVYYPEILKEFHQITKIEKSKRRKVSKLEELDIEDLGNRTKFCRCWKSKSCPNHDASHEPSKRQAALCNDSNALIMERKIQSERPYSDRLSYDIDHFLPSSPEHNAYFVKMKSIFSSSGQNSTNHNDRATVQSQSSDASLLALLGKSKATVSNVRAGGSMGEKISHSKPTVTFEPHPKYAFIAKAESTGSSSHLLTIGDIEQNSFNEESRYNKVAASTHMEGCLKKPTPFHGSVESLTSVLSPINSPDSNAQLRSIGLNRKGRDYIMKKPFRRATHPDKKLSLLSTITEFSSIEGYNTSRRKITKPCNESPTETDVHLKLTHETKSESLKCDKFSMNSFSFSPEVRQGLFQKTRGDQKHRDSDIFSTADEAGLLFTNSITTNQSFYLAKQNPSWLMSAPSRGNLPKTNEVDNLNELDNDASSVITHYSVFSASKNESSSFMERLYSSTNVSEHFSFESDSSVSSLIDGSMSKCPEFMSQSVKPFTEDYCLEQPFLNKTYSRSFPDGESKPFESNFFGRNSFSEVSEKTSSLLHLDTKVSITTESCSNDETFSKSTFSRKKANAKAKTDQLLINIKNAKYLSAQMGGPHPTASAVTNLHSSSGGETTLPSAWKGLKIISPTNTNQAFKEKISLCRHLDRIVSHTDVKLIDYGHCEDVRISKSLPEGFVIKKCSKICSESNESVTEVSDKTVLQNRCEAAQKLSCSHRSFLPTTFLKSLQLKADSSQHNRDESKDGKRPTLVIGGKHVIDYKNIFQKKIFNEMVLPSVNKYIHRSESDTNVSCSSFSSTNTSVVSVTNLKVSDSDTDSLTDNDDTNSDQTFCESEGPHISLRTSNSASSLSTLKP